MLAKGGRWVKEDRDETGHGSQDGYMSTQKSSKQYRIGLSGPEICPDEVIP